MGILRGKIVSGDGDYARWIAKFQQDYRRKTGLTLFPGTLNIRLNHPYILPPNKVMRLCSGEYEGTKSVSMLPIRIMGRQAVILRPDLKPDATEHDRVQHVMIIEVATDVKLRDGYGLKDGDEVEVEVI